MASERSSTSARTLTRLTSLMLLSVAITPACAEDLRRFPLESPLTVDTDLRSIQMPCRPNPEDQKRTLCTPSTYVSSFAWDGADNLVFRPIAQFFKVDPGEEAINVNSLDETPDSAWFTNRLGSRPMSIAEIVRGSCGDEVLDGENDAPGSWLIDLGKPNGANPGFRVRVEGKGKFMVKADQPTQPEKGTGAAAVASRFYYAAGWWAPCDSIVLIRPELLSLKPGLTVTDNTGVPRPFDAATLSTLLEKATKQGSRVRMVASKWLPGRTIGPFRYAGTRPDDPNDIIPHEDRRDLRGARVMAAWLNHFDSREQNSMDTWMADDARDPDSSPGHVRHWYIDLGDCFGSEWSWEGITARLGHAYYLDLPYLVEDFVTLGMIDRPWDRARRSPVGNIFAYFSAADFDPDLWRGGYPNPAFSRMTERDAAWAARIIARFTPEHIEAIVGVGRWSNPAHHAFLVHHLRARQQKILERYFSKLSPVTDLEVRRKSMLCGVDLARRTGTFSSDRFTYRASLYAGLRLTTAPEPKVEASTDGGVCVSLPHFAPKNAPNDAPNRYAILDLTNGVTPSPLRAHLYDLGPDRGFMLVGIERPWTADPPTI